MWARPAKYSRVDEASDDDKLATEPDRDPSDTRNSTVRFYRIGCFVLLGLLVTLLLFELVRAFSVTTQNAALDTNARPEESPCGNTTKEARDRGCEFDLLSYTWLPQECLDRTTSNEFREWLMSPDQERGAWPFFSDEDLTIPVADETTLSERTMPTWTYTTWKEHLGHCNFMTRRMQRSMTAGFGIDPHQGNIGHIVHCTGELLKAIDGNVVNKPNISYFGVLFGSCK